MAGRMGLTVSGFVALAIMPVLWRWRGSAINTEYSISRFSIRSIIMRLLLSMVFYVAVYLVFGYFVAWQDADVRALYGGGAQTPGFWRHITTPPVPNRVIPFQLLRGLAWTLLCVLMLRVSQGSRLRIAIAVGLFLAVIMNSQLLLPNPVMTEKVRHIHLVETAISTFLFGLVSIFLWTNPVDRHTP